MLTKEEAQRIALCVSALRPDWSRNGLMAVLADDRCRHRVPRDITLAFVALALDPTSRKPTRIFEAGPWWDVTRPVGPTVQQYRVIGPDDCGVCYRPAGFHSKLSAVDDHEWEPQRFGQGVGPTPEQKAAIQAARIEAEKARTAAREEQAKREIRDPAEVIAEHVPAAVTGDTNNEGGARNA
jgi:hypothetical protein